MSIRLVGKTTMKAPQATPSGKGASASEFKKNPDRRFGSSIISIYVGPKRIPFYLHKEMVTPRSAYFKQHFGPDENNQTMSLDLPDEDPDIVGMFVQYIYCPDCYPSLPPVLQERDIEDQLLAFMKLFILTKERFRVSCLQVKLYAKISMLIDSADSRLCGYVDKKDFLEGLHKRIRNIREVYENASPKRGSLQGLLAVSMALHWNCFCERGLLSRKDGEESDLSRLIEEVPSFTKDLMAWLQSPMGGCSKRKRC